MIALLLSCLLSSSASAHDAGENYLTITAQENGAFSADWNIPYEQLEQLWTEKSEGAASSINLIARNHPAVATYAEKKLEFTDGDSPCTLRGGEVSETMVNEHPFAEIHYEGQCGEGKLQGLGIKFHHPSEKRVPLLLSFTSPGGTQSGVTSNQEGEIRFGLVAATSLGHFWNYVVGGVHHIWEGVDHILFLLTLMLPAVYVLHQRRWQVRDNFREISMDVVKTISAFTLAHSVTLCLVTFGWLDFPSRLVESVIALSVLVAGLNNLFPIVGDGRWKFAFAFGLVHGIGFAEVLVGLKLPTPTLVLSLVGYNLGVELGQLSIVAAFLPVAYLFRRSGGYRLFLFTGGSAATALVAALWLVDRVLAIHFMPF